MRHGKYQVDVSEFFNNEDLSPVEVAEKCIVAFRKIFPPEKDPELDHLLEELRVIAAAVEEFDEVWSRIYDWADSRDVSCWINVHSPAKN